MVEKLLAGEQGPSSQPGELILGIGQGPGVPCRDRATQHWVGCSSTGCPSSSSHRSLDRGGTSLTRRSHLLHLQPSIGQDLGFQSGSTLPDLGTPSLTWEHPP